MASFDQSSLVLGLGLIMFFLLEFGLRLQPFTDKKNDPLNKFKLFFIIGSFLMGLTIVFLVYNLATDQSSSTQVLYAVQGSVWIYTVLTIIGVFGLLIYFLVWIPKAYKAAIFDKDDGEDFEE